MTTELLKKKQIKQLTDEWYKIRNNIITASDVGTILGNNKYSSKRDVLIKKIKKKNFKGNYITNWGHKYEHIAIDLFSKMNNIKIYGAGLLIHDKYNWLGASPDGILENDKLIEIKCPIKRNIDYSIPIYYLNQIQIQLEVCNFESCYLFQCKFEEININEYNFLKKTNNNIIGINKSLKYQSKISYWKLSNYRIDLIKKNKSWFNKIKNKLLDFKNELEYFKKYPNLLNNKRKLKSIIKNNKKLKYSYINLSKFINIYHLFNFLNNDPFIDWIKLYDKNFLNNNNINNQKLNEEFNINKSNNKGLNINKSNNKGLNINKSNNIIFNNEKIEDYEYDKINIEYIKDYKFNDDMIYRNNIFREKVYNNIKKRFNREYYYFNSRNLFNSYEKYIKTKKLMRNGVPIIIQPLLINFKNKYTATPDLIIRSDFIQKVYPNTRFNQNTRINSNLKNNIDIQNKDCIYLDKWYYININLINIKLNLGEDNYIKYKSNIAFIKGKSIFEKEILGVMQNYEPENSYIHSHIVSYQDKLYNGFDKLGCINHDRDYNIINKIMDGIKWIKNLRKNGKKYKIGEKSELYPNMCNRYDKEYREYKLKIAKEIKEITLLPNISYKKRMEYHKNGIYRYDKIQNHKNEIINKIIKNKYTDIKLFCKNMKKEIGENNLYVDFETTNLYDYEYKNVENYNLNRYNTRYNKKIKEKYLENFNYNSLLYLIGICYKKNGKIYYKKIICKELNYENEKIIIKNFIKFIKKFKIKYNNSKIIHWGKAEQIIMNKLSIRHNIKININWFDLCSYFKDNKFIIKNCFSYSLKDIVNSLFSRNIIKYKWKNEKIGALDAIIIPLIAQKLINNNKIKNLIEFEKLNEIISYNKIDCKMLYYLINIYN